MKHALSLTQVDHLEHGLEAIALDFPSLFVLLPKYGKHVNTVFGAVLSSVPGSSQQASSIPHGIYSMNPPGYRSGLCDTLMGAKVSSQMTAFQENGQSHECRYSLATKVLFCPQIWELLHIDPGFSAVAPFYYR